MHQTLLLKSPGSPVPSSSKYTLTVDATTGRMDDCRPRFGVSVNVAPELPSAKGWLKHDTLLALPTGRLPAATM
jgi:hypothetical protein